jgi:hypothetical protein
MSSYPGLRVGGETTAPEILWRRIMKGDGEGPTRKKETEKNERKPGLSA